MRRKSNRAHGFYKTWGRKIVKSGVWSPAGLRFSRKYTERISEDTEAFYGIIGIFILIAECRAHSKFAAITEL